MGIKIYKKERLHALKTHIQTGPAEKSKEQMVRRKKSSQNIKSDLTMNQFKKFIITCGITSVSKYCRIKGNKRRECLCVCVKVTGVCRGYGGREMLEERKEKKNTLD